MVVSWAALSTGEHVHTSHVHIHVHVHDHVAVAPGESTHLVRLARHDRSTLIWFCRPNSTVSPSLEMIRGISITRGERETAHVGWWWGGGSNWVPSIAPYFVVITNVLNFTLRPYKKYIDLINFIALKHLLYQICQRTLYFKIYVDL